MERVVSTRTAKKRRFAVRAATIGVYETRHSDEEYAGLQNTETAKTGTNMMETPELVKSKILSSLESQDHHDGKDM